MSPLQKAICMIYNGDLKALIIRGDFSDMSRLLNEAYKQGKKIFKTNTKIRVVHTVHTPFGWVVLVARPSVVVASTSGRLGVETENK